MRYLLVTHIPFALNPDETIVLDRLWAEDLRGLVAAAGSLTVAAPRVADATALQAWGAGCETLLSGCGINFIGLPRRSRQLDLAYGPRLRGVLRKAVDQADLVHTSNLFEPDTPLYFAHDYAVRSGRKTLFVVAEDFVDMLAWEWVRTAHGAVQRLRRGRAVATLDRQVRRRVANASLTFLHTPAAVERYRLHAANAVAIRQPVHEREDVIAAARLEARLEHAQTGAPLRLVTASRLKSLKGLDMLLRAIAILERRGINVSATLHGEGPDLQALQALAVNLGITERVSLPGGLSSASVLRKALADADLFLMPHLTNDFGRAFFDALAAACPVIAFRSIASQDTVLDGIDGLLAPNADPEDLAHCIARFDRDRTLLAAASRAARLRALENTRSFWNEFRMEQIRLLFSSTD